MSGGGWGQGGFSRAEGKGQVLREVGQEAKSRARRQEEETVPETIPQQT